MKHLFMGKIKKIHYQKLQVPSIQARNVIMKSDKIDGCRGLACCMNDPAVPAQAQEA